MKSIKKFEDFLSESKSTKDKESLVDLLVKMLDEKPEIVPSSSKYPTQKGAYTLSSIKRYFRDNGKTNADADDAIYQSRNDKESGVEVISVKDHVYDEYLPLYYKGLSKEEADKIKQNFEKESSKIAAPEIEKKKEIRKAAAQAKIAKKERKSPKAKKAATKTATKTPTKKATIKK